MQEPAVTITVNLDTIPKEYLQILQVAIQQHKKKMALRQRFREYYARCQPDRVSKSSKYAQEHAESVAEYQKAYQKQHKEQLDQYDCAYRAKNREKLREYKRRWYALNRAKKEKTRMQILNVC